MASPQEPGAPVGSAAPATGRAEAAKLAALTLTRTSSISEKCSRKAAMSLRNVSLETELGPALTPAGAAQPCWPIHFTCIRDGPGAVGNGGLERLGAK